MMLKIFFVVFCFPVIGAIVADKCAGIKESCVNKECCKSPLLPIRCAITEFGKHCLFEKRIIFSNLTTATTKPAEEKCVEENDSCDTDTNNCCSGYFCDVEPNQGKCTCITVGNSCDQSKPRCCPNHVCIDLGDDMMGRKDIICLPLP